mmetsp:Transcript_63071/g.162381  ORF Transcript_63071/g.162381 Transcript_63071/m.162381 type:complete len:181 (+) Transcript_63071:58-600(+)
MPFEVATAQRRRGRLLCLVAVLSGCVAGLIGMATAAAMPPAKPPGRSLPARTRPASISTSRSTSPGVAKSDADWLRGLVTPFWDYNANGTAAAVIEERELQTQDATKLLVALGSIVGAASLADSAGLVYVADLLDIMDAQALISDGLAEAASLGQDENLINLQLALQDGTEKIITLFSAR